MPLEIVPLPEGELHAWFRTVSTAFGGEAREADIAAWERITESDRVLCLMDDETMVGGGSAFSFRLTVPGGEIPAAGVTAVGVLPTHRRRGGLTALMRSQLAQVRERGEPVAILWASEGSIYQRFGYGLAALSGGIDVERHRTLFRTGEARQGEVRLLPREEAERLFPAVYERLRGTRAGFFSRTESWWSAEVLDDPEHRRDGAGPRFFALHETADGPEGYAIYRLQAEWDATGARSTLHVLELMATTTRAARDLWRFVFDVDLVARIQARHVEPDHPLLLMVAEPRRLGFTLGDGLWLRVVDPAAALAGRSYGASDTLVLELSDDFLPQNAGRWRLRAGSSVGSAERTEEAADLALDVTDLGAVYLGAFSFADLARAGRTTECRPGARERADRLFRTDRAPWCPQVF